MVSGFLRFLDVFERLGEPVPIQVDGTGLSPGGFGDQQLSAFGAIVAVIAIPVQKHDLICILSKRTVITDTLIPLHHKTRRYRRIAMEDWNRATKTKGEHYEIYEAIVSGNAELAEELTTRHIVNAKKHMMEEMKFNG